MGRKVLLSGAASLVGAEVLAALLAAPEVESIRLLVPAGAVGEEALRRLAAYLGGLPERVSALPAALIEPRFGLSVAAFAELAAAIDLGLHCAERTRPDQDLERARRANVWPLASWCELLGQNPELTLHHLSTAFVGGTRRGLLTEFDLDCGQGFHHAYERSKFEAERALAESAVAERVTVYRPSHVLGRAADGRAFELGGAYPLLGSLATGRLLAGDGRARLDLVPADFVGTALARLALAGARGTFHLVNGWEDSLPIREAAELAARAVDRRRGPRLLPRAASGLLALSGAASPGGLAPRRLALHNAEAALCHGLVCDRYRAEAALLPLGLPCPPPRSWLPRVVAAAAEGHWRAPAESELERAEAAPPATAASTRPRDPIFHDKRFHRIGDVDLAYRDLGSGEPVVFFHGWSGAHSWDRVVERVMQDHRVIVVETLGISDSRAPLSADYGLPAQAARARGLLSALEIPAAHIVSNDTGSAIAQIFAARWPQVTKSLVLSDFHAAGGFPAAQVARLRRLMRLPGGTRLITGLLRFAPLARSGQGFRHMVFDRELLTRERLAAYLAPLAGSRERRSRLKRFTLALDKADLDAVAHLLARLTVPTLIIWGADDRYTSPSWGKRLYDEIPGARRLELIPFAGISCHEERPDLFAALLADFWAELAAEVPSSPIATEDC